MRILRCSDGLRAAADGEDLATVARSLSADDLDFWIRRCRETASPHEASILEAEALRRSEHWLAGPLWRSS